MSTQESDAGDVAALGEIIWDTSRSDESTISATGANHVARAILASDWLAAHDAALIEQARAEGKAEADAEREALDNSLADSGCHGFRGDHPDLYTVVEAILAARAAEHEAEVKALSISHVTTEYHDEIVKRMREAFDARGVMIEHLRTGMEKAIADHRAEVEALYDAANDRAETAEAELARSHKYVESMQEACREHRRANGAALAALRDRIEALAIQGTGTDLDLDPSRLRMDPETYLRALDHLWRDRLCALLGEDERR